MTLEDLIRRFRTLAKDVAQPYRAEDVDVIDWFNDAQAQACVRGRLLVAEGDLALCRIPLIVGQSTYPLHRAIYELIDLRIKTPCGESDKVDLKSREWLDAEYPKWRECKNCVRIAIQTDTGLRLVGQVEEGEVLELEAYRMPLEKLENNGDKPEIHDAHHEHLIHWALHKAFSVPDSELFDPDRAALSERAFTDYFGILPDSGMRRETRHDVQHYVRGYMA